MTKKKGRKVLTPYIIVTTLIVLLVITTFIFASNQGEKKTDVTGTTAGTEVEIYEQTEGYGGEKGEQLAFENEKVEIDITDFDDGQARFHNVEMPSGTTVYFFVVRDDDEIYRAAANECQICFSARTGFRQEGSEMICNNCGNRYPINLIATEKGGCNPIPINPNLEVENERVFITLEELEKVSQFF